MSYLTLGMTRGHLVSETRPVDQGIMGDLEDFLSEQSRCFRRAGIAQASTFYRRVGDIRLFNEETSKCADLLLHSPMQEFMMPISWSGCACDLTYV